MLSLRVVQVLLVHGWFQHTDVGQIAVALRVVQAVADPKLVGNAKADVIEIDGFHALASLVQQRTDAQAARFALPQYVQEGKSYLTVAIGCTGGQHRSVMIAEALKKSLADVKGVRLRVKHRES